MHENNTTLMDEVPRRIFGNNEAANYLWILFILNHFYFILENYTNQIGNKNSQW
jgi:hypothetical protein